MRNTSYAQELKFRVVEQQFFVVSSLIQFTTLLLTSLPIDLTTAFKAIIKVTNKDFSKVEDLKKVVTRLQKVNKSCQPYKDLITTINR